MPANYVLLEKITVGAAGAASVTFSGIPQTGYTDLVVKVSARDGASSVIDGAVVRFNNDTTSGNYTARRLIGSGSAASSDTNNTGAFAVGNTATANTFSNCEFYIPNYTGSTAKSVSFDNVGETNATTQYMGLAAFLWSNTAAITTITISGESANFLQYSTFYLYGVAKLGTTPVIVPYATGGDTIMTDGTYWYHAFRSSGTFTPAKGLSCDVLVVAGGGGGGNGGGAGGAGGVLAFASQSVSSATTITIGAGGSTNTNGSNSQFASLTASVGGGTGGTGGSTAGALGGSGGGGSGSTSGTTTYAGGAATSGQGNAGGGGLSPSNGGGGGGGAGGAGATGTSGGAGGAGTNSVTNWGALSTALTATGLGVSGFIAGGGGGYSSGAAGSGGAGAGGGPGAAATANTGSGGGGYSGAGGSGLILVRYLV
jgi:hypothetical protein